MSPLILFLVISEAQAQDEPDPPMEWESISKADLAMTSYAADTNTSAVVLCDYGETTMNDNVGLIFSHHVRIKILSAAGYRWGSYGIVIYSAENTEQVSDIEGVTYTLGPDNSVIETKLEDESIIEEKVDDRRTRYRFTLPGLMPGCIVEYRYKINTNNLFGIRDWYFQTSIPTLWSEYRVTIPDRIAYSGVYGGYESFFINEERHTTRRITGRSAWFLDGTGQFRCNQHRLVLRDAPAIREEPFITTPADYCNRLSLQLAEIVMPTGAVEQFMKTWPMVVDELLDHGMFGKQMTATPAVRALTQQLTASATLPEAKMAAIYDHLRTTVVINSDDRVFAEKDPGEVLASKAGSNAEITFLLISMLRCAGIDAHPVLLSTRANGAVHDLYPIISQFNYVLAAATIGTTQYLLDATDPLRPMELLPTKVLNVKGLLVKKGPIQWLTLSSPRYYSRRALATVKLSASGALEGIASSADEGYSALAQRRNVVDKKGLDFAKELFGADGSGVTIDSVQITGLHSLTTPLTTVAKIASSSYAQVSGNLMFVNPFVIARQSVNPFTLAERKYPVEMSYLRRITIETEITLPEDYRVKELPKDVTLGVGNNEALFSRTVVARERTIQVRAHFETRTVEFRPALYKQLREFYDRMVVVHGEHIVLERQPGPTRPTGSPKKVATKGKR